MFSSENPLVMISGVFLALAFIVAAVHYVNRLIEGETKDLLVRFILLVFASLVGVFIVDKIIASRSIFYRMSRTGLYLTSSELLR